ncbi:MAG: hypothetical protein PHH30_03810 [Bacteroidales bacterium]|nr:hypothetical protein [Bacteroidales bacterium]
MKSDCVRRILYISLMCLFCMSAVAQNDKQIKLISKVEGFGIMYRLPGIWRGPVGSTTSAGSFDKWFVDLRPVSATQISQFSLLDENTVNNYSFFVVKYKGENKIALRTEGCFANSCCITYEIIDSVNETEGYYRFSDFVGGVNRAYTEIRFEGNKMTMEVYTTKFNELKDPVLHSSWVGELCDIESAQEAISKFKYPKIKKARDFTGAFVNMTESIFFVFEKDPYKSSEQPYTGKINIKVSVSEELKISEEDKILIILSTKPWFDDLKFLEQNTKYESKAVYLNYDTKEYVINNVHPGKYYIYSFVDRDKDGKFLTGDYMSSSTNSVVEVNDGEITDYLSKIDLVIP